MFCSCSGRVLDGRWLRTHSDRGRKSCSERGRKSCCECRYRGGGQDDADSNCHHSATGHVSPSLEVSPSPQPVTATPTPSPYVVLQVAAQEIIDDYDEDRSEADEKYKGVVLEVFGEIARVKKDDEHYIIFHIKGGPDNVRCNLAPGQVDKWARLNEGDRVVVVGTGVGKNRGRWGDFNLDACTLNPPSG